MKAASGSGENRTKKGVTTAPKTNNFTADTTFLSGKLESDKGGTQELRRRGSRGGEGKVA